MQVDSMSSAAEAQSHLYVALDQRYIDQGQYAEIYEQTRKSAQMISGLIKHIRSRETMSPKNTRHLAVPTSTHKANGVTKQTESTRQTR